MDLSGRTLDVVGEEGSVKQDSWDAAGLEGDVTPRGKERARPSVMDPEYEMTLRNTDQVPGET